MTKPAPAARQVQVELLSVREELTHVIRLAFTVVLAVWFYLASSLNGQSPARRGLLPYQTLIENRSTTDQRMFRELQEGLLEAEAVRSTAGAWPPPTALAHDGIPPFALDPTAKGAHYNWQLLQSGAFVNYLGVPDQPGAPAWLLLIQEPAPGAAPDQPFEDEEHHRLLDGAMLHVSTWNRTNEASVEAKVVPLPQATGWTQLYAVGPGVLSAAPPPPD